MNALITKNKKPWYIWFSFPAFAMLWGDTCRRIYFGKKWIDFWGMACGNFFKIIFLSTLPVALFAWVFDIILPIPELAERTLVHELAAAVQLLVAYVFGVYAAYKHYIWRQENIAHLLTNKPKPAELPDEASPDKAE